MYWVYKLPIFLYDDLSVWTITKDQLIPHGGSGDLLTLQQAEMATSTSSLTRRSVEHGTRALTALG